MCCVSFLRILKYVLKYFHLFINLLYIFWFLVNFDLLIFSRIIDGIATSLGWCWVSLVYLMTALCVESCFFHFNIIIIFSENYFYSKKIKKKMRTYCIFSRYLWRTYCVFSGYLYLGSACCCGCILGVLVAVLLVGLYWPLV